MRHDANARFAIKAWNETAYSENEGQPKLTRASVTKTYSGDIEGEAQVEYLMMYRGDGSASFVGLERVVGRIGDGGPAPSYYSAPEYSKAGWQRSPTRSSPARRPETCMGSEATGAPRWGTGWSILLR